MAECKPILQQQSNCERPRAQIKNSLSISTVTNTAATTSSSSAAAINSSNAFAATNTIIDGSGKIQKITTLLFDLDNTLIPTRAGDSKATKKLADVLENQFAFTKEESSLATQSYLKAFRRCPDNTQTSLDSWRTYLWREALPNRYKHLAEQIYFKWLQLRYRYLAISADYVQMLNRFREAGFLMALITNGPSNAQWEKIKKLHASQYFDCVLVSSDLPWEKPNPDIFFAACNYLGVKPAQCVMIGDKLETDIKGGRLAKLGATFWIPLNNTGIDLTGVTHPPDFILRNLLDLYKYFPILNGTATAGSGTGSTISVGMTTATAATSTTFTHATSMPTSSVAYTSGSCCSVSGSNSGSINSSHSNNLVMQLQSRRRHSQISRSATTSTCDSDPLYHRHSRRHHHNHQVYKHPNNPSYNKYRRGGSLPTIECLNSETENSSDSLFS